MDYFMSRQNVDLYTGMMADYDNSFIINEVKKAVPSGSLLLEVGMGTGADLLCLAQHYNVTGSDSSPLFVDDFKQKSNLDVCVLDAVTMDIDKKFDCIFSNKVLQHLSKAEFLASLKNQSLHLNNNGILFFTLWHGEPREEFEFDGALRFVYYDASSIKSLVPKGLKLEQIILYPEFEKDDSMIVILRRVC